MAALRNSILLNGKVYDVGNGDLAVPVYPPHMIKGAPTIDGVIAGHSTGKIRSQNHHKKQAHKVAKYARARQLQHSKTLMRNALKKPYKVEQSIRSTTGHQRAETEETHKLHRLDHTRLKRAQNIPKSPHIRRFSYSEPASLVSVKKTVNSSAKTPPSEHQVQQTPAQTYKQAYKTTSSVMLAAALRNAESHKQPTHKPARSEQARLKRRLKFSFVAFAIILGLITLIWIETPNIRLKMAASRAGINAKLPGYKLGGFSVSSITANPGVVTINYQSNSDNRTYSVIQRTSDWNSQTLLHSEVLGASTDYQTLEYMGRTIYVYKGTVATWVDGGIWYKIESNSTLSPGQITNIVDSL